MNWEWLKLIPFVFGAFLGVLGSTFSINSEKDLPLLETICKNNRGTKSIRIDLSSYRVYCKDGAYFQINR